MSDTSASLLQRLREQPDGDAWRRLVFLYTPLLRQWLARHGLQSSDIDDLTQEVLTVVVRELPQFQHNQREGAFRRWLRTILVHRLQASGERGNPGRRRLAAATWARCWSNWKTRKAA